MSELTLALVMSTALLATLYLVAFLLLPIIGLWSFLVVAVLTITILFLFKNEN